MKKPRVRFSFLLALLPAVLVPLSHGCGDSSVECLGTPVACSNRDIAECNAGCSRFEGCLGGRVDCASLTDEPMLCAQTVGCQYLGSCDGPPGCSENSYQECPTAEGCV